MIAALGFIHVMGRDKKRHAFTGELEEQIPEFAPRDRIDASSRLIKKEHARPVHERARHGQPLTPAAGKLRSAPVNVWPKMSRCDHFVPPLVQFAAAQAIKLSCKDEVLIH